MWSKVSWALTVSGGASPFGRFRVIRPPHALLDNPVRSREAFEQTGANEFAGDELSNRYFNLLTAFIEKFSLRYDLRRPCTLCPTLPGVFASLVRVYACSPARTRTSMH